MSSDPSDFNVDEYVNNLQQHYMYNPTPLIRPVAVTGQASAGVLGSVLRQLDPEFAPPQVEVQRQFNEGKDQAVKRLSQVLGGITRRTSTGQIRTLKQDMKDDPKILDAFNRLVDYEINNS